jgi:hypothetical protein
MLLLKRISKLSGGTWEILKSPRVIALIKVGIAVLAVVQAIEELRDVPRGSKSKIGFKQEFDNNNNEAQD